MEEFSTKAFFYRLTKSIWYVFSFLEFFLVLRFFFYLFNANSNAGFTKVVYAITDPFLAPFATVFNPIIINRGSLDPNIILALFVYYIITWGIIHLILMARPVEMHEHK